MTTVIERSGRRPGKERGAMVRSCGMMMVSFAAGWSGERRGSRVPQQ
jgi:hypothetical protein